MMYHAGHWSSILNARYLPADMAGAELRGHASLTAHYEYLPSLTYNPIRVLVAGDHDCLRASLKTMLELDPNIRVVGEAADDCEAIKMARRLKPDVLLIDLDMRCCDDFEAVAEITDRKLATSIVALTIHQDQAQRAAAQAAGVNLFLEKGVPYKQLISAIRLAAANTISR